MRYIDTDTHVFEPISVWTDYVDPALRDRAPSWVHSGDRLLVDVAGTIFPTVPQHRGLGNVYGPEATVDLTGNDPAARLAYMDAADVSAQVIYPTLGLVGFPGSVADPDLAAGFSRAYNRYMAEFCSLDPKRLRGSMLVPFNHPARAVEEMRWAREHGLEIAVSNPTPPGDVPWSDERFDVIWQTAEDLGIPMVFHEVTIGCPPHAMGINRYAGSWPMIYLVTHVVEAVMAMTDMILGGACERHPRLQVGLAEAHVAWAPGWMQVLDANFDLSVAAWQDRGLRTPLTLKPSEYFGRQCFLAAFPDDPGIAEVMDRLGGRTVTVSSDWPHPIGEDRLGPGDVDRRDDVEERHLEPLLTANAQSIFSIA